MKGRQTMPPPLNKSFGLKGEILIMKKKQYDEPIIELLCFERKDVVTTSDDNWLEPVDVF